jgi:hypothetical protein
MTTFHNYLRQEAKYENTNDPESLHYQDVVSLTLSDGTFFDEYYVVFPRDNNLKIESEITQAREQWLETNEAVFLNEIFVPDLIVERREERQRVFTNTIDQMNEIWFNALTDAQKTSLSQWRQAWLDYPSTGVKPNPTRHEVFSRAGTYYGYLTSEDAEAGAQFIEIDPFTLDQGDRFSATPDGDIHLISSRTASGINFEPALIAKIPKNSKLYLR